jgi:hypothetical protein
MVGVQLSKLHHLQLVALVAMLYNMVYNTCQHCSSPGCCVNNKLACAITTHPETKIIA